MTADFRSDLESLLADLNAARAGLVSAAHALSDGDLDRARRGGWSVRRVFEHVIHSEWLYARLVYHLRGLSTPDLQPESGSPATVDDAICRLDSSRFALLQAVDGVDEESFYRLGRIGHEEYSVMSVLENAAQHDREHLEQIQAILRSAHGDA
jgi:hypothetical protein